MKGNCNKCIIANTFKNICEKCNKDKNKRNNKMNNKVVLNYSELRKGITKQVNKCNECDKECDLCEDDDEE